MHTYQILPYVRKKAGVNMDELAEKIWKALVESWCDQYGAEIKEISITKRRSRQDDDRTETKDT